MLLNYCSADYRGYTDFNVIPTNLFIRGNAMVAHK